jgi:hypothetical protein
MSTAGAFDCKVYRAGGVYIFCGLRTDTQVAEYIFTYLRRTVFNLMKERMNKRRAAGIGSRGCGILRLLARRCNREEDQNTQHPRDGAISMRFKSKTGKDLMVKVKNGALDSTGKQRNLGQAGQAR